METLMSSILVGIKNFPFFFVIFTAPILVSQIFIRKKINVIRIGLDYAFILYSLCFFAVVFLPLPTISQAANLTSHDFQFIPFHFIVDIIHESPLDIKNVHTYLPAITNKAVLQVVFNVLLTVPFGMFLKFYLHKELKKVIFYSLALSLFVEVAQLTGLFFIYKGSYRLCDVDDLMANTLGGYVGYKIVSMLEEHVPSIEAFDVSLVARKTKHSNLY